MPETPDQVEGNNTLQDEFVFEMACEGL